MDVLARHQCLIYEGSPATHVPGLVAMMLGKLKAGYRCLVLNNPAMLVEIRGYLEVAGVNVDEEVGRGALRLSADQSHLVGGQFDVDLMLNGISAAVSESLRDGYRGLWATGDMTWEFGGENNFDKLLEYEQGLEKLFHTHPALSGICQYHRDTVPDHALQTAFRTHAAVYVNETLSRIDPHGSSAETRVPGNADLAAVRLDKFVRRSDE